MVILTNYFISLKKVKIMENVKRASYFLNYLVTGLILSCYLVADCVYNYLEAELNC